MYRITIEKIPSFPDNEEGAISTVPCKVYEQTVEELDIRAVMAAVNQRKRGPRAPKKP